MDRRVLLASGLSLVAGQALAQTPPPQPQAPPPPDHGPLYPGGGPAETYSHDEIVRSLSDFFGVTAEAAGAIIEKVFKDNGRPTGYIAGEEGSVAITVGLLVTRGNGPSPRPVTPAAPAPSAGVPLTLSRPP